MNTMQNIISKAWDIKETIKFMREQPMGVELSAWDLVDGFIDAHNGDKNNTVNGEWYDLWNNMEAGFSWCHRCGEFSFRRNDEGLAMVTRVKPSSGCWPR